MEYVDVYNKFGEKTGEVVPKLRAHELGLYHKAVNVWIVNKKGELLVQRRNYDKKVFPNMLDISFAGHVSSGETSIEALCREGKEEIGIDINLDYLTYLFSYRKEFVIIPGKYFENEIDDVYLYEKDINIENFRFEDNEVSEVKYIDFRKLEKMWKEKDPELIDHEVHLAGLFYVLHEKFDNKN